MEPVNAIINNNSLLVAQLSPSRPGILYNARIAWRQVFMTALYALDEDIDTEEELIQKNYAPKYPRRIQIRFNIGNITSTMIDDAYSANILSAHKADKLRAALGFTASGL